MSVHTVICYMCIVQQVFNFFSYYVVHKISYTQCNVLKRVVDCNTFF